MLTHSVTRAMRDQFVVPPDASAPIASINTTPLIDVMLVLLIMFIIVVPVASHKVPLDLPPPAPASPAPQPPVHRLDILPGGGLYWDGRPIAPESLPARLRALPEQAELHLNPDAEARYGQVDWILAEVRRAGVYRLGFLDNRRFAAALEQR